MSYNGHGIPAQRIARSIRRGDTFLVRSTAIRSLLRAAKAIGNPIHVRRAPRAPGYHTLTCGT